MFSPQTLQRNVDQLRDSIYETIKNGIDTPGPDWSDSEQPDNQQPDLDLHENNENSEMISDTEKLLQSEYITIEPNSTPKYDPGIYESDHGNRYPDHINTKPEQTNIDIDATSHISIGKKVEVNMCMNCNFHAMKKPTAIIALVTSILVIIGLILGKVLQYTSL